MSILIDETTKVLVQGFTGDKATFHAKEMIAYGTQIVGGVTPGKGGGRHLDRPVFNTVKEAVRETGATASIIFVPAAFCADSIMEAADAGVRFVVTITDGIPAQEFFNLLLAVTMQGFFADPVYGGNRDKVAWKMIGYPGVIAIYSEHIKTYRNKRYDVEPKSIVDLS